MGTQLRRLAYHAGSLLIGAAILGALGLTLVLIWPAVVGGAVLVSWMVGALVREVWRDRHREPGLEEWH